MAEGGFDFENPTFDRDDYDDDDIDDRLPMVPDEDTQQIALNQSDHIAELRENLHLKSKRSGLLKHFMMRYKSVQNGFRQIRL